MIQFAVHQRQGKDPTPFSLISLLMPILQGHTTSLDLDLYEPITPCKHLGAYFFLNRSAFLIEDLFTLLYAFDAGSSNLNLLAHAPERYASLYLALRGIPRIDQGVSLLESFFQEEWEPPALVYGGEQEVMERGTTGFTVTHSEEVTPLSSWPRYRSGDLQGVIRDDRGYVLIFSKSKEVRDLGMVQAAFKVVHDAAGVEPLTTTVTGDLYGLSPLPLVLLLKLLLTVG